MCSCVGARQKKAGLVVVVCVTCEDEPYSRCFTCVSVFSFLFLASKRAVQVKFNLPSSSYATMCLRQLFGGLTSTVAGGKK